MISIVIGLSVMLGISLANAQQEDWTAVGKIFGRSGSVQQGVYKITFPRSDLNVMVGDFRVDPGLALTSWVGFMKMNGNTMGMKMNGRDMVMGDLVLLDDEVEPVISGIVSNGLEITAIHNHLVGESPSVKYVHFSGTGDATKLAEKVKSIISLTATPITPAAVAVQTSLPDWSAVEAILGKGKTNGDLLQYSFARTEKLTENKMEIPPYFGMATGVNFQRAGNNAAIAGDFVLLADEVNPVVKALTENGISVTALHNHMLYDNPRLFMMHFWAVGDPAGLARGIKAALDKTNSKK